MFFTKVVCDCGTEFVPLQGTGAQPLDCCECFVRKYVHENEDLFREVSYHAASMKNAPYKTKEPCTCGAYSLCEVHNL